LKLFLFSFNNLFIKKRRPQKTATKNNRNKSGSRKNVQNTTADGEHIHLSPSHGWDPVHHLSIYGALLSAHRKKTRITWQPIILYRHRLGIENKKKPAG
jgi:hypothetical protein